MAVYTNISLDEIKRILSCYTVGEVRGFAGITEGVSNSNFLLITDSGRYIYTIFEDVVNKEDVPFFLELMQFLSDKQVLCPKPIPKENGELFHIINEKSSVITSFLIGKSVRKIQNQHCKLLGEAIAKMHIASQGFDKTRENDSSVFRVWDRIYPKISSKADEIYIGLKDELESAYRLICDNWPENSKNGIIHGDLFPDNVFFNDNKLSGIIDFYYACNDIYMYDIAICLNSWCFEDNASFNITKAKHLLRGYNSVRKLSEKELECLPVLCAGAALRFLLTRIYDLLNHDDSANVIIKDPMEKLKILRFHMQVKSAREYGI